MFDAMTQFAWYPTSGMCCFVYPDYDFELFPMVDILHLNMCCFVYQDYDFELFHMFDILHLTCVALSIRTMILNCSLCLVFYISHMLFCVCGI